VKLYSHPLAPNPRRARIFLAEKDIGVPVVQLDIFKGENREPAYLAKNPLGGVPFLELDDGTIIAESVAICRFFEEMQPEPNLMGHTPLERAQIEMWQRRMELQILANTGGCFRHTNAIFAGRFPQVPEYGRMCRENALRMLEWLDAELASRPFVAGARYTIADITALVGIDLGRSSEIAIGPAQKNLARWYELVASRPSAKA
jgi:glutathione S-transferase